MAEPYRIRFTSDAFSDLEGIFEYIHHDSPQDSRAMATRIVEGIDSLYTMPSRCKVVGKSRTTGSDIHAMVISPFVVYYRVDEPRSAVFVLTMLHGARQQPRSFD
jgi:plasmid stabilization system protein ParE